MTYNKYNGDAYTGYRLGKVPDKGAEVILDV
jgi:hypothetical protein